MAQTPSLWLLIPASSAKWRGILKVYHIPTMLSSFPTIRVLDTGIGIETHAYELPIYMYPTMPSLDHGLIFGIMKSYT